MNETLKVAGIIKKGNRIEYQYEMNGKWKELLNENDKMFVEYTIDIERVPDSIAIVPFLCNILPISWAFGLKIEVDTVDEEFYKSIPNIKKGYIGMFPSINLEGGTLEVQHLENYSYKGNRTGTLFSGGVDAFSTLISHIDEKPTLLTIWGADIKLDDVEGWNIVNSHHIDIAKRFGLDYLSAKTNFKTFLDYKPLAQFVKKYVNDEWWHAFQHGIGVLGIFAPVAYLKKMATLYIASSFTADYKGHYTCASDPTIDNELKFSSAHIVHDGYELNRQDKIHNICNYFDENKLESIPLRVCWISSGGGNCCECEKCYRTILGIMIEKHDPKQFGLDLTSAKRSEMMKELPKYAKYNLYNFYKMMQERFKENYTVQETPEDLMWFRHIKIYDTKPKYIEFYEKIINFIKRVLRKILRMLKIHKN